LLRITIARITLILVLISSLTFVFHGQLARAWNGTIYIDTNGDVSPSDAPIQRNGDIYTLTDNITSDADGIIIQCDDIVIDGAGHAIQGALAFESKGMDLTGRSNVTIRNTIIEAFDYGIYLFSSSNVRVVGSILVSNYYGIWLFSSSSNQITGNKMVTNVIGIGLSLSSDSNNIFHNSFRENNAQAVCDSESISNVWDDGYPAGGNYWSDYNGSDYNRGSSQNVAGSDGIGDTPYTIDDNNADHYPLTKPYGGPTDVGITDVIASKNVVDQGYTLNITVKVLNYGEQTEAFSLTAKANTTVIWTQTVALATRTSETITYTWNTSGLAKGNYTINAYAEPVLGETDTTDNNVTDGWIIIAMVGDITGIGNLPDGKCDAKDVALVASLFGVRYTDPRYKPNSDVVYDGKIDARDVSLVAKNFGKKDP